MVNQTVGSKNLYKLFLSIIKFIPSLLALTKILGLILGYCGITSFWITCVGGTSVLMLILLYIISSIFRFCVIHRLSLHYVSVITIITIFAYYFEIPIVSGSLIYILAIITGIFIISYVILMYTNRKNPKIDHIKQLCENYAKCKA